MAPRQDGLGSGGRGILTTTSLPIIKGPSNRIVGGSSDSLVHGPKGLVRVGDGAAPKWYSEAIKKGTQSIVRVPELEGGSRWQLTAEAREDLFRPKPKEDVPKDDRRPSITGDRRLSSIVSPPKAPSPPPAAAPKAEPKPVEEVKEKHQDRLVRRNTEKDLRASARPPEPPSGDYVAPQFVSAGHGERPSKAFDWIRFNNQEHARAMRREIAEQTRQASLAGGYRKDGRLVRLNRVKEMLEKTERIAPSLGTYEAPKSSGAYANTKVRGMDKLTLNAAQEIRNEYRNGVGAVSAASSYHCGGGFETGGRHALEEAICIQSTSFVSLSKVEHEVLQEISRSHGRFGEHLSYIPPDGVILSPFVEVFRDGSDAGYPFLKEPVQLAALISLGMYNRNDRMSDCPVDAPPTSLAYKEGVKQKFRSMFAAAIKARCIALVVPDVGCGVYQNDAKEVGTCLGEVLREEFWCHLREVVVVGKKDFQDACIKTCESVGKRLEKELAASMPAPRGPSPPPARISEGRSSPPPESRAARISDRRPSPPPESTALRISERRPSPPPESRAERRSLMGGLGLIAPSSPPTSVQMMRPQAEARPSHPPAPPPSPPLMMARDAHLGGEVSGTPDSSPMSRVPRSSTPEEPPPRAIVSPPRQTMCKFNCGRPVAEGLFRGKPFETCCRSCAVNKGDGSHGKDCALGEVVLHQNHNEDRGRGGRRHSPTNEESRSGSENARHFSPPPPMGMDRPMCKFGCGRRAKPGVTRSGKPFDTCCRECGKTKGGGGHSPECEE